MKSNKSLGLELSALHLKPGEHRTQRELVIWMEAAGEKITYQRIQQIEQKALRKIRIHVTRELNADAKEVLFDGIRLLSQTRVNLWDRTVRRLQ